jgi:peptidoglycan/xylan/chitin deacetylase (PgdA/CDA1 family)
MKRANVILLITTFFMAGNAGYAGTVASPYQVGNWPGFRTAAVTYTFDDQCSNQFAIAIPMFNEFGFKLTLYPVINWGPNWTALVNAAAVGHEVGSHTMSHPTLSPSNEVAELSNSKSTIESNITNQKCVTVAYPFCSPSTLSVTATYYIAGRHCQGWIEPNTPTNMYQISSLICGSAGAVKTAADFNSKFVSVASSKGWCVFLIHGIDNDGGYSPLSSTELRASLQYLDARRSTYWVATFANAVRYIRERNDVSVAESSNTGDSITLQVTDTLDNTIYNYPVTISRPLPDGWQAAKVSQNGQPIKVSVLPGTSGNKIMFDVVPDGGDVALTKTLYGDFTGGNAIELDDLDYFFSYWLSNDYSVITDGVDLDGDRNVNFYEFAVLAQNWLQTV